MSPKPLKKQFYFMSPVQAVKVTTHNIEQAAEWCGGVIKTTDSRRHPGRTDKYIDVPVPKGGSLVMAFPGMWITKRIVISLEDEIKVSFAVFRRDFFEKNYFLEPVQSVDACWVRLANQDMPVEQAIVHVNVANPGDVGKALQAAREKMVQAGLPIAVADNVAKEIEQEMASEPQIPAGLTPYEQRALITEDGVEDEVVAETGNVVLPSYAASKHPSLRERVVAEGDRIRDEIEMLDPTNFTGGAEIPVARGDVHDPFKVEEVPQMELLQGQDAVDFLLGGPATEDTLTTPLEDPNAAQEIPVGPGNPGELDDSEIVGSASAHRAFIEGGIAAAVTDLEGRSSAQASADKAAYEAELKAIEDGSPDR